MTVSTLNNRVSYAGNGVTTEFSFPNRFLADADLVVLEVNDTTGAETPKTLTTHYTVTGAGDAAGGTITMLVAPATGVTLVAYRDPALTQPIDLVNGDPLDVDAGIERGFDRSTLQIQRVRDLIDRTMRLPEGDTGFTAADMELPAKVDRASKLLAFDADGKPLASAGTGGTATSVFMATVVDDLTSNAALTTLTATRAEAGAVAVPVLDKLREVVSVKDFGAVGDGVTNDTAAINAAVTGVGTYKLLHFPAGTYLYDGGASLGAGVVVVGDGRNTTIIKSRLASPTGGWLIRCDNYGSGVRGVRFEAAVTQTGGSYVVLTGPESFIEDFYMTGDYNGVLMSGSVSRIRHGRFQDGASGAIRIRAEGGDNSQLIEDVLMGAQTPANTASAGIRVQNSSALMILNTSVIQQGTGLLINPDSTAVFSLYCSNCFFDNGTFGIRIIPTGTGGVYRSKFVNVWCSSSTGDGVVLSGAGANSVYGIDFYGLQSNLNAGAGVTTSTGCRNINFYGGNVSQNAYGFYLNSPFEGLGLFSMDLGVSDGLTQNVSGDMVFGGGSGYTNARLIGNHLSSTTKAVNLVNVTSGKISDNIGIVTENSGTGTIVSGSTAIAVTHGLTLTPTAEDIAVTLTENPTNDPGNMWISSITATQFTVNCRADPGASNLDFAWHARIHL